MKNPNNWAEKKETKGNQGKLAAEKNVTGKRRNAGKQKRIKM
jgi:hypothetical protein